MAEAWQHSGMVHKMHNRPREADFYLSARLFFPFFSQKQLIAPTAGNVLEKQDCSGRVQARIGSSTTWEPGPNGTISLLL